MQLDTTSNNERTDTEPANREARIRRFLEQHIWPQVPEAASGRWTKDEVDAALDYGEHGEPCTVEPKSG